ncbi:MAG TPA: M15 family metallopeptidase [Candidatus Saccharimonas sp.]|nr:M15 family metallopeptidase [Candidatus Saccharimonas sp.]
MRRPSSLRRVLIVTVLMLWPFQATASSDLNAIYNRTEYYSTTDPLFCDAGGPATVDGHVLPATKGGSGYEEPINSQGQLIHADGSLSLGSDGRPQYIAFSGNANLGQNYQDYYITMRWRIATWDWSGNPHTPGPENSSWYSAKGKPPRVLVTNPRTGRSIIAVILESGPAPWTGVDTSPNNNAKQGWVNPQDGTPATYHGRVSGFPPVAYQYLGYSQRMSDGSGEDLLYSWAPDQNAQPGPYTGSVTPTAGTGSTCGGYATGNFIRDTKDLTCPVGADAGVQTGYAGNFPEPYKTYDIRICNVQGINVNALIAVQVNDMLNLAKSQGYNYTGGGFRTMAQQEQLRIDNGCPSDPRAPSSSCRVPTAQPGYSNHQMGLAIDFSVNGHLITDHADPGFVWLDKNAAKFGLKNLPVEPWHWSVDGH